MNAQQGQGWEEAQVSDTMNAFDYGESRTPIIIVWKGEDDGKEKKYGREEKDIRWISR